MQYKASTSTPPPPPNILWTWFWFLRQYFFNFIFRLLFIQSICNINWMDALKRQTDSVVLDDIATTAATTPTMKKKVKFKLIWWNEIHVGRKKKTCWYRFHREYIDESSKQQEQHEQHKKKYNTELKSYHGNAFNALFILFVSLSFFSVYFSCTRVFRLWLLFSLLFFLIPSLWIYNNIHSISFVFQHYILYVLLTGWLALWCRWCICAAFCTFFIFFPLYCAFDFD